MAMVTMSVGVCNVMCRATSWSALPCVVCSSHPHPGCIRNTHPLHLALSGLLSTPTRTAAHMIYVKRFPIPSCHLCDPFLINIGGSQRGTLSRQKSDTD